MFDWSPATQTQVTAVASDHAAQCELMSNAERAENERATLQLYSKREVFTVTLEVFTVALEVSTVTLEVFTVTLEVTTVALEVFTVTLEVSTVALEVSTVTIEV